MGRKKKRKHTLPVIPAFCGWWPHLKLLMYVVFTMLSIPFPISFMPTSFNKQMKFHLMLSARQLNTTQHYTSFKRCLDNDHGLVVCMWHFINMSDCTPPYDFASKVLHSWSRLKFTILCVVDLIIHFNSLILIIIIPHEQFFFLTWPSPKQVRWHNKKQITWKYTK